MKTVYHLLLTAGLLGTIASEASAQCQTYPGYFHHNADRYYNFQLEGRAFSFDRQTSEIFCGGVKIGIRTPEGQVQLLPDAANRIAGPGAPVVGGGQPVVGGGQPVVGGGQPVVGGQAGVAGQPAIGGAGPVNGGTPAINGPATGGPTGGPATGGPAAGAPATSAPAGAPVQAAPAPTATTAGPGAIPSLGSGISQVESLFFGQWRAENKNILGRNVVRELTFNDDKNLTLRVQAAGEEAQIIEGAFELKDGKLNVKADDENRELGLVAAENGQLVLKGAETLNFKRIEE